MYDMNMDRDLFSVGDLAVRYGVHRETVRRWVRENKLPSYRLGKNIVVRAEDLANTEKNLAKSSSRVRAYARRKNAAVPEVPATNP